MPPIDQTEAAENQPQDELDTSTEGTSDEAIEDEGEGGEGDDTEGGATDEDETVITLGGEPAAEEVEEAEAAAAPAWVRDVRKTNRELVRKTREQEAEIARLKGAGNTAAPAAIVVGEKPTFETCEFDPEKFEAELTAWNKRKAEADAQQQAATTARANEEKAWRTRVDAVEGAASKLKVRDPEGAILAFDSTFSVLQRGIIMGAPEDVTTSAALRYALGSNPARAKALAAITDPIKFAMKLADEIKEMTMTTRKPAPVPERRISGNVAGAAAVDNTLNKLREEAARTGNHSKVIAYKNEQKKKARQAA